MEDEVYQQVVSRKLKDGYLDDYASWANKGVNQGITISVNGVVYTGVLIGVSVWCDKMISQMESSNNSADVKDAIISYYETMKAEYHADAEESNKDINFIHMDNVRIISGGVIGKFSSIWRFKVDDINGFSVGTWQDK